MMDFFTVYNESITTDNILVIFNTINYGLNIFTLLFLMAISCGMMGYAKKQLVTIKSRPAFYGFIIAFAALATLLNYFSGIYLNFVGFIICYICIVIALMCNITRKSLKWFTSCLCMFVPVILLLYWGSLYIVVHMNDTMLNNLHMTSYEVIYKSFFEIYQPGSNLLSIYYNLDNNVYSMQNNIVYKRIYIFYYFMNNIALLFWLFVYHKVLGFHAIKHKVK